MAFAKKAAASTTITIKAPNFEVLTLTLVGTAPFVSNKFSEEARIEMAEKMAQGETSKAGNKKRPPKDFEKGYQGSLHKDAKEGWFGIPAKAFRSACIRSCSVLGVEMTKAKQCIFVLADGYEEDGMALVKITKGKPERFDSYVRNDNGKPDIRARGRWQEGWECKLRVRYDADLFSKDTVANLLARAGISVGIGAGRPFSTDSDGMGWGTFEIKEGLTGSAKG